MINPEHHQLVLERLGKTIELAKTLKGNQFDYSSFVSRYDVINECGTICCIAGHYPNWGIEGFYYRFGTLFVETEFENMDQMMNRISDIAIALCSYHLLVNSVIDYLFFGSISAFITDDPCNADFCLSLPEVISRFEEIYELVLSDNLDNSLYYVP